MNDEVPLAGQHPDDAPRCASLELSVPVSVFASGWTTALQRPARVSTIGVPLCDAHVRAVSLKIRRQAVKTYSFVFPQASMLGIEQRKNSSPTPACREPAIPRTGTLGPDVRPTRIKPPGDIIKLEDRLYYVLQPPVESLVRAGSLDFPGQPFPYQLKGVAFLYPRYAAILADEMGLGKTMQAITAIRLLLRAGEVRRVLLVCPKPLVTNWQREFSCWAPEIPLAVVEGEQQRRVWQWQHADTAVKIANYELLVRDEQLLASPDLRFDLVVLDEAQRIKNRSSTTSRVARSINRSRSWALTGTPVENSSDDLVGIFDFLAPGYLSSTMSVRRMGTAARDYILRRTKNMVLTDLPPKMFRDAELDLTHSQWDSYRMAESEGVVRLESMGAELTIQHVFELILRLKQICNFDPVTGASSKLERLEADLEEVVASGQKAIVFSQWVQTLQRIRQRLSYLRPLEFHGRIATRKRDQTITQFQHDPAHNVLLMSYGAGSVGLNLQFCRYVFLFDRWWNPAVEDQAINRAHRIGAAGQVTVTRMLTLGTIEERINQVLDEKRQLFEAILSQTGTPRHVGLSHEEIFGLFKLRC